MTSIEKKDLDVDTDLGFYKNRLKEVYKELPEFLKFVTYFAKGKQGITGLLENTETGGKCVYKISQDIGFLVDQEYYVMKALNELKDYCPHFCKTFGKFDVALSKSYKKLDNPFSKQDDKKLMIEVLLIEYIKGKKLYDYVKNSRVYDEYIIAMIKQALIGVLIGAEKAHLTHYDLHSDNVLIKECPVNSVFVYIIDSKKTFLVPTYGYYPMIIDYGFSYNDGCIGKPIGSPMDNTEYGFLPVVYDKHRDARLLLCNVSYEFAQHRPESNQGKKLRTFVKNLYKNCDVDLTCGWDEIEKKGIAEMLAEKLQPSFERSKFFRNQGKFVVDNLINLVYTPIKKSPPIKGTDLDIEIRYVVNEFMKIEKTIGDDKLNLYIFKNVVKSARNHRKSYLSVDNTKDKAVAAFKADILRCIDSVVKYCQPKDINYEKLLCSLICLSKSMSNYMYKKLKKSILLKEEDYQNIPLKSTGEILEAFDVILPSHFFSDKDTVFYIWDVVNKKSYQTTFSQEIIDELNETHPAERGSVIRKNL